MSAGSGVHSLYGRGLLCCKLLLRAVIFPQVSLSGPAQELTVPTTGGHPSLPGSGSPWAGEQFLRGTAVIVYGYWA